MRTVPRKFWRPTVALNPTRRNQDHVLYVGRVKSLTDEDIDELCDILYLDHPERLHYTPFTEGFCNEVFKIVYDETEYVVKKYSDLSKLRASLETCVKMQGILAERSLCPHVIATTEEIIVTEYISGKVLSEQDMLDNSELMESLADLTSRLHAVTARDENVPLIWMWFQLMLARLKERGVTDIDGISTEEIAQELSRVQHLCGGLDLHLCLCHGDLKPSNIILQQHQGGVKLIDMDLCGINYRGFDTMKLFRTDCGSFYDDNLLSFLQLYHQRISSAVGVAELFFESQLFEPLTWLEAALFFAVLTVDVKDKDGNERNILLFNDRWAKYKETRWKLNCFGRLLSR